MRTALFTDLRKIEIREAPAPSLERPGDVLVRIDRLGVCGSDVHYHVHGRIGDQVLRYPASLGHECAGTVVEVGAAVENVRPGDRVAVDPALTCGGCDQCRAGRPNTCRKLQFMGCPNEAPGAASELCVLPAVNCFPIPNGMTLEQAALAEPLSIGLYAVRLAGLGPDRRIAILGCGPIGLGVLACTKMTAPATVYATDLFDERLDAAGRLGADWTGNASRDDAAAAIQRREPLGVDVVFECSGDPECLDEAIELAAPGGTVMMVGIPPVERVSFHSHVVRRREITLRAVRRQRECVAPVIAAIADGRLDTSPFVTHRYPLERIADAFELVAEYRDGVIKAMVALSAAE